MVHSHAVIDAFIVSEDESASPTPCEILFRIYSANKNEASIYGCVRNYPRLLELLCKKKSLSQCALFLIKNPPLQIPVMAPDTVCLLGGQMILPHDNFHAAVLDVCVCVCVCFFFSPFQGCKWICNPPPQGVK